MSEEQRRRRRPPTMNRRSTNETSTESTEGDNRNGGSNILDTLPEEKTQSGQYRRVYSDWKPTVEKTDVVGTMEAIAGIFELLGCVFLSCSHILCSAEAQQPANITLKDKSAWRKSNLNQVNNSNEKADVNARTLRRLRSRTQMDCPPTEVSTTDAPTKDTLQVGV
jgi:hypothetical protein